MKIKRYYLIPALLLVSSCNHQGIIDDAPVEVCKPDKVVSVDIDTTLHCTFPEVLNIYDIQIINDTVFTLMDQVSDSNAYHFKAYSTNNFEYMGAFIRKGRGPGEMMEPRIMSINSYEKHLKLKDNALSQYCAIDVEMSIKNHKMAIASVQSLSSSAFDCFPLPDSSLFLFRIDREMFFQVIDKDGNEVKTFRPYEDIDAKRYLTHLSSILTRNGKSGKVAEIMIFFPQINIFDTDNGTVRSFAVSRAYRNWKSVISRQINLETTTQYYVNAASGTDYIFAAYKGIPLEQIIKGGSGTSIHVFDWDGNFKYDIKVREDIDCMTFDGRTKKLYCIEKQEGKIIRYDLSGLL